MKNKVQQVRFGAHDIHEILKKKQLSTNHTKWKYDVKGSEECRDQIKAEAEAVKMGTIALVKKREINGRLQKNSRTT